MSTPMMRPWEGNNLQNSTQIMRNANAGPSLPNIPSRSAPVLPPRPTNSPLISTNNGYNSYNMPYSGMGYGNYNSYGSYGMPYRSSLYNSYGSSFGGYNSYGMYGNVGYPNYSADDHERRFIQYAEESSRNTFANVESIVRAFNSIAMMLDNTFFAMTSSFRAVLSVAENFGKLRSMFGHIWYSINIFRIFNWLYRKLMQMMGFKVPKNVTSIAWNEASRGIGPSEGGKPPGSSWPTIAFLGVLVSAPYIISKFLPKYEDKGDPTNWKTPGIRAKAVFDFIATAPNELTVHTNDIIMLAPTYIQEEMNLKNSGWAFAVCKGKSGVIPLNYLVISKNRPISSSMQETVPIPRSSTNNTKTHTKRVSFGENQIFENVDLDDYIFKKDSGMSSRVKNEEKASVETSTEKTSNEVKEDQCPKEPKLESVSK